MQNNNHKLIIGLGNPGKEYAETRHNAGFLILNELKDSFQASEFKFENKFNAEIAEKILENGADKNFLERLLHIQSRKLFLLKPQSFMNKSGEITRKFIDFYKIPIENITIIHDDLDMTLGTFKLVKNSGAAGHNGVQNIIDLLGTQDFHRIKIGVEQKSGRASRQIPGDKFVLQKFSPEELAEIKSLAPDIKNIIPA